MRKLPKVAAAEIGLTAVVTVVAVATMLYGSLIVGLAIGFCWVVGLLLRPWGTRIVTRQ